MDKNDYRNSIFEDIAQMVAISTAAQLEQFKKEQKDLETDSDALDEKKQKRVADVPVVRRDR